ncbi:hypothetical protein GJ688_03785 [Heliobacillus mobilis]|uniref:Magnesium transporter n=1 Tax=Heliobacterium mobile TaxID=28064 RepID=A0A6I3SH18_HELMO|nr:CorA family divalent cation transporter [Heliobacterium mobile]MTV48102.1 hypothetical protein [Heliobacterium mobile]
MDSGGIPISYTTSLEELPSPFVQVVQKSRSLNRLRVLAGGELLITVLCPSHDGTMLPVYIGWDREQVILYSQRPVQVIERHMVVADQGDFQHTHRIVFFFLTELFDLNFHAFARLEREIEKLEERIVLQETSISVTLLFELRKRLLSLHRDTFAKRRLINKLIEYLHLHGQEQAEMIIGLRDLLEDISELTLEIQGLREALHGLLEIRLSLQGQKTNQIMQKLTVVTSIFMPLTLIAGIYGMNFKVMPELEWSAGYFLVLVIMTVIAVGLLLVFRRRKWI